MNESFPFFVGDAALFKVLVTLALLDWELVLFPGLLDWFTWPLIESEFWLFLLENEFVYLGKMV